MKVIDRLKQLFHRRPEASPEPATGVLALEVSGSGPRFIGCLDRLLAETEHRAVLFDKLARCVRFSWSSQTIPFAAIRAVTLRSAEGQRSDYGYELRFEGPDSSLLTINDGRRMRAQDRETTRSIERVARLLATQVGAVLSEA